MITVSKAREITLSIPEAKEGEHMNHPDIRVRKKVFATLWPDESRAVIFLDPESHKELLREYPEAFSLNGWSEKYGALNVHLEHAGEEQLVSLIRES